MEVTLIVVTLVSIALAIAMGILTWRLLQEERLRSDARVAALEQGLAETMQDAYVTQAAASQRVTNARAATSDAASSPDTLRNDLFARDDTDWLAQFPASAAKPATTHGAAERPIETRAFASLEGDGVAADGVAGDDVSADTMTTVVNANGGLFGQIDTSDNRVGFSRHALAVAAVAAVMIGAVLAFWTIGRLMEPAADRPGTVAAGTGANGANGTAPAPAVLELMSLSQAMQNGMLTISGLVRNPHGGVTQERLTAVVFFFDGQGGFLSSTRAPLDYRALAPGDESPFQLSAPAPPGVARYRVSFRRDEGAVVPHVDRRQQVQQSLRTKPEQHSKADRHDQPRQDSQPRQQQEASRS